MQRMQILQICFHFRVLAMTFCVGVRNCPSRSRWVANKQPRSSAKGENTVSEDLIQLFTNLRFSQNQLSSNTPQKFLDIQTENRYLWGWLNISATYIQWLQIRWWELCERKSFSHWLRFVIWTRGVFECSSNLKFPRLFSANDPPLSFRRCCTALPILDYCQSKMKPCNAMSSLLKRNN